MKEYVFVLIQGGPRGARCLVKKLEVSDFLLGGWGGEGGKVKIGLVAFKT